MEFKLYGIAHFRIILQFLFRGGGAVQKVGRGAEAGGRDEWGGGGRCVWQRVPQLIVKSASVNCKADRLSAFSTSRAKMSAIRTRHDKTT